MKEHLGLTYEALNLDLGDVEVVHGSERWVFERKSISDLYSSIVDGRYREQKQRMLSHVCQVNVTYIIESVQNWCVPWAGYRGTSGSVCEMLVSAILNLQYRDGVRVVFTKDAKDTCNFIEAFVKRVSHNKFAKSATHVASEYVPTIKSKKKDNIDRRTCLSLQLSCIPGVSLKTANKVIEALGVTTMHDLYTQLTQEKGDAKAKLCQVPGIGKGLATKILEFTGLKN